MVGVSLTIMQEWWFPISNELKPKNVDSDDAESTKDDEDQEAAEDSILAPKWTLKDPI
jgi:hypothetical protein